MRVSDLKEGLILQEGTLGPAAVADSLHVSSGERHRGAAAAHQAAEGRAATGGSPTGAVKEAETEPAAEGERGPEGTAARQQGTRGQEGDGPERGLPPRAQLGGFLFCPPIVFKFRKSAFFFLTLGLNQENLDSIFLLFPPGQ